MEGWTSSAMCVCLFGYLAKNALIADGTIYAELLGGDSKALCEDNVVSQVNILIKIYRRKAS
jgi:hypothetical protein